MSVDGAPLACVVDASLMVRRVAARIIRDFGYEVVEFKNATEALDAAALRCPDVLLCDWDAGDMDAPALIAALRDTKHCRDTRVILCTANRSVERIEAALAAGAVEYIIKPFDSDIIESKFRLAGLSVRLAPSRAVA